VKSHLTLGLRLLVMAALFVCREPVCVTADNVTDRTVRNLGTLPEFSLTNQSGEKLGSRELAGRTWIANFIFTRCPATCPAQTRMMAQLQDSLEQGFGWNDISLVSFSVDPEHDTSEILGKFAADNGADPEHWQFLTGKRDEIWRLCKDGFMLPVGENPPGDLNPLFHSSKLVLIDGRGQIRGYYEGLTEEGLDGARQEIQLVVREETADPTPPSGMHRSAVSPGIPVALPPDMMDPSWMLQRAKDQLKTTAEFRVFHDFRFSDHWEASKIRFHNRIVDDAGRSYKAAHYDHGNGVAIADVDGDGYQDIYFSNQVGSNQLWRNRGDGTFHDITQKSGVAVHEPIGVSASFADIDNDGDPDLYVTTVRAGNRMFENDGSGRFMDITKTSGLGHRGHSSSAVFFDYDRDGMLDLFLANVGEYTRDKIRPVVNDVTTEHLESGEFKFHDAYEDAFGGHLKPERTEPSLLFRNLGQGRFEDVTAKMNLFDTSWSGDASPMDRNGDGWIDLYVLNMQGHDQYYENRKGKKFVRRSRVYFPATPWGSMGIKVFDYNNDGDMDIYITDMHSDMSIEVGPDGEKLKAKMAWPESLLNRQGQESIYGNAFFRNQGRGKFKEVSDEIGAENYWPWGVSVGDLNADGYDDAFVASSMNYPYRYGINTVLLNNRGEKFMDSEFILGVEPRPEGRRSIPWFELDCSGADQDHKDCDGLAGRVAILSWRGSRSSVIFDLDNDGDLDIVTNEFNAPPMVLVSNLTDKQDIRFLKVKLTGSRSNRNGLGAVVRVHAGDQVYTKVHDGQSGYLSQSLCPLYFGLDGTSSIERIEVDWPSGKKQVVEGPVEANQLVDLQEPAEK